MSTETKRPAAESALRKIRKPMTTSDTLIQVLSHIEDIRQAQRESSSQEKDTLQKLQKWEQMYQQQIRQLEADKEICYQTIQALINQLQFMTNELQELRKNQYYPRSQFHTSQSQNSDNGHNYANVYGQSGNEPSKTPSTSGGHPNVYF